jgi:hypothetical protein
MDAHWAGMMAPVLEELGPLAGPALRSVLIGDEQLPADCEWNGIVLQGWPGWLVRGEPRPTQRVTFTTWHHWTKDAAPLPSGLLGPVSLQGAVRVAVAVGR